jgi:hypothetical protein
VSNLTLIELDINLPEHSAQVVIALDVEVDTELFVALLDLKEVAAHVDPQDCQPCWQNILNELVPSVRLGGLLELSTSTPFHEVTQNDHAGEDVHDRNVLNYIQPAQACC